MQVISHGYGWYVDSWFFEIKVNGKNFTALAGRLFKNMVKLACGNTVVWSNAKSLAEGVCSVRSAQRFLPLFERAGIIRPSSKTMYGQKITGWEFLAHPLIVTKMLEANERRQKRKNANECNGSVPRGRKSIPGPVLGYSKEACMDFPGADRDCTDNRPVARRQPTRGSSLHRFANSRKAPEEIGFDGIYQYPGTNSLFSNNTFTAGNSGFVSRDCGVGAGRSLPKAPSANTSSPVWVDHKIYDVLDRGNCIAIGYSGAKKFNQAGMAGKPGGENPPASISGAGRMDRAGSIYQYQRWEIQIQEDFQLQSGACSRQFGVTSRQIDLEKGQNYLNKTTKNQYDTITPSRARNNARNKYNININIIPPSPPTQSQAPADTKNEGKQEEVRTNSLLNSSLAAWDAACTHLQQKLSGNDFELWIKPIQATETEAGLRLDCQDRFHLAGVQERFGTDIRDAMQLTENTKFYFSFGEKEREIQEENERKEQIRAAQLVIQQRQALQKMSVEEQFTVLFDNYPPHRRSSSDKQPAFMFFQKALKRGETSIFNLLTALKRQRASERWQKDQGRWVPGIKKWFEERRWEESVQ